MESLSRPFRRKKLPSFSAYDDVFAGGNGGAPAAFSSRIEDYKEIFRGSCSSIPVLDLSALDGAADVAGGLGKKMDYSKIFGGGRDDDVAASYEEVFAQRSPAKKASRINEPTLPGCRKEEENQNGTPNQSLEGAKQYNTFYNRTSQGNKDGENGKTLVAHIKAVPGFTCFIDENIKKTGDKFGSLPKDKTRPTPKVSVELDKKQSTNGAEKIKSQSSLDKLNSLDRNVDANGSNLKTQSFKQSSPARAPVSTASDRKNSGELKFYIPKSGVSKNGPDDCSRSFSDEELDVDSAAAVSSAALRKAVREAEASIRLAKEIMEKNKNGFQKFPKIKKKIVEKSSIQATKTEKNYPNLKENEEANVGVRETNNAKSNSDDDGQAHITKLERKKSRKSGKMSPNFIQSVENCVAENIFGKRNEDKLEASADFKAEGRFPEPLKIDDYKTENSELKHPIGNYMRLFSRIFPGNVNEHKLETSADSKSQGQFPDLVTNENQKKEALEMGATNVCNNIFSIHNISGKVDEDMLERSSDSEKLGERPNLLKKENQRNATLELENTGDNISPSICNVPGKLHKDKSEPSDDFNALGQLSKPVKTDNQRSVTLELGHTNESKFMSSIPSFSEKENEEILEKTNQRSATLELGHTDDSKFMSSVHSFSEKENEEILEKITDSEDLPESVKTDQGSATLELGHTNDSKFMSSVHSFSEKENEEILEKITDSEKLPESVKTDNQGSATLELGHTNDSKFMSSVHSFSEKENEEILGKFTDSEDLLEPVKTDKQRSATLELGHTNDSKFMSSVLSFSEKENVEILETFIDSEDFIEPEKTDNRRTATLELGHTDCSETRPSVHSFSEKENEEKLETFTDPEDFIEPEKIDNQRAATLELGDTDCSEIKPPVHGISEQVNTEMLEKSADSEPLGQVPELEKINNQRTEILELENISGSNIDSSVHDILRKVNEGKFELSADPEALETFPELVKTDNLRTATLELGHNYDTNIIPSVYNTNECGEMENQTDERTSELLERNSKEVHRKRKQWKDFEQKPSDIKIAVDGREEGKLEPLEGPSKEINRKRRQWKDVEVKSYDIKIADDGEKCIHGQEMREKATNVEDKPKGFSSGDLYENEVVKSPEREKMEDFESLDVNINRGEDFDEAQKFMENEKIKPDITNSLTGIHERESVINIWKHNEIENNLQESSKWRDYEVAFEVESNESGKNSNIDAWKEDGSEHLGDCHVAHKHERDDDDNSFEGSERMSDASQSSIDYKEDFIFDEEEVGETSEVFQSCEFNAFETGSRFAENQVSFIFNEIPESSDSDGNGSGAKQMEFVGNDSELIYDTCDGVKASAQMQEEDKARGVYEQEWVKMRNIKEAFQPPNLSKEKIRGNYEVEEKTTEKSRQEEVRAEKEELERNDEITKREREREKNRIVVERAIREARERAYAEARERAERAAVEKATAEARERVMAEARQKFEKTNISNKSSTEKASIQAKLRSERAAVERAHAEARERALEKALSQKSNLPPSKMDGNNGESVERRNARLEKTQRTMERAAKALAEKNMRDLRAQREQAERHRLAETLDAEIKRWSSGKTGNLRALLSTLQYILGPDSGWQPVSLTEIVATSAVKKAYRKATLHVHPDKLQQRGASIQQKYICEKVFDLLKAAWNRFNSEER